MENPNEKVDSNRNKQINEKLFEKSAELKRKNNEVLEKLNDLKKQADDLLKAEPVSKP